MARALLVAICLVAARASKWVGAQGPDTALTIELVAAPAGHRGGAMVDVGEVWSVFDFEDSIVVRARVTGTHSASGPGLVIVELQYEAGRRVWLRDNPEVIDPEATRRNAVWLPSAVSAAVSLADATPAADGRWVIDLTHTRPRDTQRCYRTYDSELVITRLRARAMLIESSSGPYRQELIAERTVMIHM